MTNFFTSLQCVELFHLLFLDQMGRKISKTHYALKGGCNLRFYLKSIRYSQDIDIDVQTIRKETLCKIVNQILNSSPFHLILRSKNIAVTNISEAKQTETTQRWKIQLQVPLSSMPTHTKIEFSRRENENNDTILFSSVDPSIIGAYQLTPIYASHYSMQAALKQKIWALILRTQTQARDVFDLFHLINMGVGIEQAPLAMYEQLAKAQEHAMSIKYETFKSQVVSYLPFDYQQQFSDPAFWDRVVLEVCKMVSEITCD